MSSSDKGHFDQIYLYLVDAGSLARSNDWYKWIRQDNNDNNISPLRTSNFYIHLSSTLDTWHRYCQDIYPLKYKNISLCTSTLVLRQSLEIRNYPPSLPVNTWHEAQLATCSPAQDPASCTSAQVLPRPGEDFAITEKAPTRAFSWLKVPTIALSHLRHYWLC